MDLQAMFDQFRHICDQLENGGLTLEESITLHAQGTELSLRIQGELSKAERRVVQVISQDGTITDFGVVGERK